MESAPQVDIVSVQSFDVASLPDFSVLAEEAFSITINSPITADRAAKCKSGLAALRKYIEKDVFDKPAKAANALHKWITSMRGAALKRIAEPEDAISGKLVEWNRLQVMESERLAREAAAERERLIQEARELAEMDPTVGAFTPEAIVTTPHFEPKVRLDGVSFTTTYSAAVDDLMLLVRAVAVGKAPLAYLLPNEPALNALARSLKGEFEVPGCRLVSTTGTRS
jgi:hypothetical protein